MEGGFDFCRLYVRGRRLSSEGYSTFRDGYIAVSFYTKDEGGEPLRHYVYVDDVSAWVKVVCELSAAPGSRVHRVRDGSED